MRTYAIVLSVQSSVPTLFLLFLANGRVRKGRVPPLPTVKTLDGAAIRNANRGDSRELIRTNRFTEQLLFS